MKSLFHTLPKTLGEDFLHFVPRVPIMVSRSRSNRTGLPLSPAPDQRLTNSVVGVDVTESAIADSNPWSFPTCTRALVHGALLHGPFRGETEAGLRGVSGSEHLSGKILAHGRTMLESVTRSSTGQPDVFHLRMAIQQKVPVGAVFVLADARLDKRGILQAGEKCRHAVAHVRDLACVDDALARVGIERRAVRVLVRL